MNRPSCVQLLTALVLLLLGSQIADFAVQVRAQQSWSETFDGDPPAPQAWSSPDWDIQYHTRAASYWAAPEAMGQQHGGDCSAPPMTHTASSWPGTVYQCRNHVMTAINATEYGMIYLTPNRMADWSSGPAVIQWDMSTEMRSHRDWPDLWVTPFEDNLALPLRPGLPDVQGKPYNSFHVDILAAKPALQLTKNGADSTLSGYVAGDIHTGIAAGTNTAAARQPFRLTLTSTSSKFERLATSTGSHVVYWDITFADVGFTSGIVQLGHHSYTPWKDGNGGPQTWHWDNVSINPSVPFTMIKADTRYVQNENQVVTFASPAPANSFLRFASTHTPQVSVDGGAFVNATKQWEQLNRAEMTSSYWHPVPAGTRSVRIRHVARDWYHLHWAPVAKDFGIWATAVEQRPTDEPASEPTGAVAVRAEGNPPVSAVSGQRHVAPVESSPNAVLVVAAAVLGLAAIALGMGWWLRRRRTM